jgi:hypothetical protein
MHSSPFLSLSGHHSFLQYKIGTYITDLWQCSWGARMVCRQLSRRGICKVGAIAHPSFLKESDVSGVDGESPTPQNLQATGIISVTENDD